MGDTPQQKQGFLARKNIVFSAKRYGIDALGAMAQGLFASLLIGTIFDTLGQQLGIDFLCRWAPLPRPRRWWAPPWRWPLRWRCRRRLWCSFPW